jgi:hypothetical protein
MSLLKSEPRTVSYSHSGLLSISDRTVPAPSQAVSLPALLRTASNLSGVLPDLSAVEMTKSIYLHGQCTTL